MVLYIVIHTYMRFYGLVKNKITGLFKKSIIIIIIVVVVYFCYNFVYVFGLACLFEQRRPAQNI